MAVPNYFQTEKTANVLYDYADITSATGYKTFYLGASQNSSTTDYIITTKALRSFPATVATTSSSEYNFDYEFNVPAIIKGQAFMNVTAQIAGISSGYFVARIIHVNLAAAETVLGTYTSPTNSNGSSVTRAERYMCFWNVPETNFGVGDKLRIEITLSESASGTYAMYIDASNMEPYTDSYTRTFPTSAILDLPFKIDL